MPARGRGAARQTSPAGLRTRRLLPRGAVQVWRDAIAVTHLGEAGNFYGRNILPISEPPFSRIEREMRRLGLSYVATGEAIWLIEDIVESSAGGEPVCLADWESGALAAADDRAAGAGPAAASSAD